MKKYIGTGMLAVALLWFGADGIGQEKRTRAAAKAGTIEIIESRDGKFRFSVRDADGKYLAGSPVGHETAAEAKEAVEELKKTLADARYVNKKADAGKETDKDETKPTRKRDSVERKDK